jgi:hypothetical protein
VPNTTKPTFGAFLNAFPLPDKEQFRFRFRKEDASSEYVWVDMNQKDELLPFYQDIIMAKILRVTDAATLRRKSVLRRKNMEHIASAAFSAGPGVFAKQSAPLPKSQPGTANTAPSPRAAPYSDSAPNNSGAAPAKPASAPQATTNTAPKAPPAPPKPAAKPAAKPVSAATPPTPPSPSPAAAAAAAESLMDFVGTSSAKTPTTTEAVPDMMNFGSSSSSAAPSAAPSASSQPKKVTPKSSSGDFAATPSSSSMLDLDESTGELNRAELRANKEDKINSQVQKALEEKLEVRINHFIFDASSVCS